jgi:uncharacterized membrane protein
MWWKPVTGRWWGRVLTVLAVALAVHLIVVAVAPRLAMSVAGHRIENRAGGANGWLHAERVTPQTQKVVRSSPDLAYSACAWDLSEGPVRISAPGWDDYFSLSLYDSRSNNFFVASHRHTDGDSVDLVLATRDQAADLAGTTARIVEAPSASGVALLRYLAPTPSAFARADAVRRSAVCDAQPMPASALAPLRP